MKQSRRGATAKPAKRPEAPRLVGTIHKGRPVVHPAAVTRVACSVRLAYDIAGILARRLRAVRDEAERVMLARSVWSRDDGRGKLLGAALDELLGAMTEHDRELMEIISALEAVGEGPHIHAIEPTDDVMEAFRRLFGESFASTSAELQREYDKENPRPTKKRFPLAGYWCDGTTEAFGPPAEPDPEDQALIEKKQQEDLAQDEPLGLAPEIAVMLSRSFDTAAQMFVIIDELTERAAMEKSYIGTVLRPWPLEDGRGDTLALALGRAFDELRRHHVRLERLTERFVAVGAAPREDLFAGMAPGASKRERLFGSKRDKTSLS